jgi:PBP1b-binding outer membrane lipoprotein LpoB
MSKKLVIHAILFILLLALAGCAGSKPAAQPQVTQTPAATQPSM